MDPRVLEIVDKLVKEYLSYSKEELEIIFKAYDETSSDWHLYTITLDSILDSLKEK